MSLKFIKSVQISKIWILHRLHATHEKYFRWKSVILSVGLKTVGIAPFLFLPPYKMMRAVAFFCCRKFFAKKTSWSFQKKTQHFEKKKVKTPERKLRIGVKFVKCPLRARALHWNVKPMNMNCRVEYQLHFTWPKQNVENTIKNKEKKNQKKKQKNTEKDTAKNTTKQKAKRKTKAYRKRTQNLS